VSPTEIRRRRAHVNEGGEKREEERAREGEFAALLLAGPLFVPM